jgi:hypothetical protein
MKSTRQASTFALAAAFALALPACSGLHPASAPADAPSAPAQTGRTLVTPQADGRTAEGGFIDSFQFSEKPGDVALAPVAFGAGTARASGAIDPRHGSTWGGVALTASLARRGHALDVSDGRTLAVSLASAGSATLRLRLIGTNAALRDSGCYPVATVRVTPELKEYALPIASFAPESFCAANAPVGPAVTGALTAVEIADATVVPGHRRAVDFTVGTIRTLP